MSQPQVNVSHLIQRDPEAWTAVLRRHEGHDQLRVTAVDAAPIYTATDSHYKPHVVRYTLSLEGYLEPITCIGKQTTAREARFYQNIASLHPLTPECWYVHVLDDESWVVLDDVPNHLPPSKWSAAEVQDVIHALAGLHAAYWQDATVLEAYDWLPDLMAPRQRPYTWGALQQTHSYFFTEGPAAIISDHAIYHAGRLAPLFLQAANGLSVIRSMGGWPGILGESHLAAAADLLDDPVPMLERLRQLPTTLLHGNPHSYHWHVTLFEDQRLLDWQQVCTGPGIWDLVHFTERFDLLYRPELPWRVTSRRERPVTEETIIDSYMLAMRARLGTDFNAREARLALPAARCLYVLVTWFPYFANWFAEMPNPYTWQKVNRLRDRELQGTRFETIIGYRAHLRGVFRRFLRAYHML